MVICVGVAIGGFWCGGYVLTELGCYYMIVVNCMGFFDDMMNKSDSERMMEEIMRIRERGVGERDKTAVETAMEMEEIRRRQMEEYELKVARSIRKKSEYDIKWVEWPKVDSNEEYGKGIWPVPSASKPAIPIDIDLAAMENIYNDVFDVKKGEGEVVALKVGRHEYFHLSIGKLDADIRGKVFGIFGRDDRERIYMLRDAMDVWYANNSDGEFDIPICGRRQRMVLRNIKYLAPDGRVGGIWNIWQIYLGMAIGVKVGDVGDSGYFYMTGDAKFGEDGVLESIIFHELCFWVYDEDNFVVLLPRGVL